MPKPAVEPTTPINPIDRGCAHVLVVEDDDLVRDHVVHLIASLGYKVSEAADGATALEVIRDRLDVDLMFADVVMPGGMSGPVLADAAAQLRPDLRILFTSGYNEDTLFQSGWLEPGSSILQKPYRKEELARWLHQLCDD